MTTTETISIIEKEKYNFHIVDVYDNEEGRYLYVDVCDKEHNTITFDILKKDTVTCFETMGEIEQFIDQVCEGDKNVVK